MKTLFHLLYAGLFLFLGACSGDRGVSAKVPLKIIFETDMGNDIDDAMALDLLYKAADECRAEILALVSNHISEYSVQYLDIMNTWYGYPDIPIGKMYEGPYATHDAVNFAEKVAIIENEDGIPYFRRSVIDYDKLPTPVQLYRKILAAQEDNSVVIVSVGFSTNIANLLQSEPDEFSPLTGQELVTQKVTLLSVMAGSFGENPIPEFNLSVNTEAARTVFRQWPTPVVVTPFEAGLAVEYPYESIVNDFDWVVGLHPMIEGYTVYTEMPHDRPTWDLIAAMYALEGENENYYGISPAGMIMIDEDGYTHFSPRQDGSHRYLTIDREQAGKTRDYFVNALSRQPKNQRP